MVISAVNRNSRAGWLVVDLAIAIFILGFALLPLAFSFNSERKLLRAHYNQAIAMEIVDGETEILRAGAWKKIADGTNDYSVAAVSATNLPPGKFQTIRASSRLRLEWSPIKRAHGGTIARELAISP
jgi:hypothetical protein